MRAHIHKIKKVCDAYRGNPGDFLASSMTYQSVMKKELRNMSRAEAKKQSKPCCPSSLMTPCRTEKVDFSKKIKKQKHKQKQNHQKKQIDRKNHQKKQEKTKKNKKKQKKSKTNQKIKTAENAGFDFFLFFLFFSCFFLGFGFLVCFFCLLWFCFFFFNFFVKPNILCVVGLITQAEETPGEAPKPETDLELGTPSSGWAAGRGKDRWKTLLQIVRF